MTDVLMFVEDPGAANFMVPVIPALQALGLSVALRVDGAAVTYVPGQSPAVAVAKVEGDAAAVLDAIRPKLVFCGTGENRRSLALALTAEAKARGLPTVAAVDAPGNAAERFRGLSQDPLTFAPGHILVADDATARDFAALGYTSGITVCGNPHYDATLARLAALGREGRDQVRARALKGRPAAPVVVFASEVSDGLLEGQYRRSGAYTLHGSGRHDGRTEIVIEEFLAAAATLTPRPYTVLRLHPKNTREELAPFLAGFDEVSQGGSGLELVFAADAVCGMISVLLAEAAMAGRPVLSILPRAEERDWLPELIRRTIRAAHTSADVGTAMTALLKGEGVIAVTTQPGAAERAAAAIKNLLQS